MVELMDNPYVGPRSFTQDDARLFHGREVEARELLSLVLSERMVLFYAQSGAGKSSLLHASLVPELEKRDFYVLPVGRVGAKSTEVTDYNSVRNIFVHSLLESINEQTAGMVPAIGPDTTLVEYLRAYSGEDLEGPERIEDDIEILPQVLIIDQFEEIVTTQLAAWKHREDFFGQLSKAMEKDPQLWIVLTLREEYLATLEPYAYLVPGNLRARFYMQRLNRRAAHEAITIPADMGGRPFVQDAASKLVEDLSKIRGFGEGSTYPGQFIEPILLSVACYELWENLRDEPPGEITVDDLRKKGDVGTALARYYNDAIADVVRQLRTTEDALRNWFDDKLITRDGTRTIVLREGTHTAGLPNEDVEVLAEWFVLRPVVRTRTWYELAHDHLVQPVRTANQEYREKAGLERIEKEWQWAADESRRPAQAAHFLSEAEGKTRGSLMSVDVYVQTDTEQREGQFSMNQIYIASEPGLLDGPTSARIAVVDYDPDTGTLEEPARWDNDRGCFVIELNGEMVPIMREHRDLPQFHQVSVWGIIQSVLQMYEAPWVLGHPVPWAFEGNRLIVQPHAGNLANTFYDRRSKSIKFGYFGPPDSRIYTCLSHDLIAHETAHAILDGLRPYFLERSSFQTDAFHEFVADLTVLLSYLLNSQLGWQLAEAPAGDLSRETSVARLAEEFGLSVSGRLHLRSGLNNKTMREVADSSTPWEWSEVLTGAMWDILVGIFARYRTKPRQESDRLPTDKQAFDWAVNRFQRLALQPLDYLPPVDVQFSDYARAVLSADAVVDPVDEYDFRWLMRDVFEKRGISFSTEETELDKPHFYAHDTDRVSLSRTDAGRFLHENHRELCIPVDEDISVVDLYRTDKTIVGGGRLARETILQYIWRERVPLKGTEFGELNGETLFMLCGGTLVFDDRGNVLNWVRKPGSAATSPRSYCAEERARGIERRKQFLEYVARLVQEGATGSR